MTAPTHPPRLFSTRAIVEVCARTSGPRHGVFEVPVRGSGPDRTLCALEVRDRFGLKSLLLAPLGLYASPGWEGRLEPKTIADAVRQMKGPRVRKFSWKVRFDEEELASALASLALDAEENETRIVPLEADYAAVEARFEPRIRRQVRQSHEKGVTVRIADADAARAYSSLHARLAALKGGYDFLYPPELFADLVALGDVVRLLVAERDGRLLAGALFFHDADSLVYWHGAMDREYSNCYPTHQIFDTAFRWGAGLGASFVNMGGSIGIATLEAFKDAWGARPVRNRQFTWRNPVWSALARLRRASVA